MARSRYLFLLVCALGCGAHAADLWDNRALRIIQTTETNFPPGLLMDGVREGSVRTVLQVDANGKLLDCLVTGATHPALATELLENLRDWKFEPPRQRGEPVGVRVEVMFKFEAHGQVVSLSPNDILAPGTGDWAKAPLQSFVCRLSELDAPPKVLHVVPPLHPGRHLNPPEPQGTATIDFFIDTEGRPRMPVVTRASHEAFGDAAVMALAQWQFAPPTRGGRPVLVRAVQQFTFSNPGGGSDGGSVAFARKINSTAPLSRE